MICALNVAGEIILINKKGLDILGYEEEKEILGKNWFEVSLPRTMVTGVKDVFHQLLSNHVTLPEYYEKPCAYQKW